MTYKELLLEKEWDAKCCEIIGRDLYSCQDCGALGFHKNSYVKLSNLEDLDNFLCDWRLKKMRISKFFDEKPFTFKKHVQDIPFTTLELNNPFIYELSLFGKRLYNPLTSPTGLKAVCDYEQKAANANLYDAGIVSNVSKKDANGSLFILEFDNKLSDNTYVNIEYHIKGYFDNYPFDKQLIDFTLINVTSGNYFFSLRLNPIDSGFKCLNIHHKYYVRGRKPWEYPNDALITLCQECHQNRHHNSKVPLYNSNHELLAELSPCPRCGGSGYLPQYHYHMNGICFECGGEGVVI